MNAVNVAHVLLAFGRVVAAAAGKTTGCAAAAVTRSSAETI
jgi:hypothetical protein